MRITGGVIVILLAFVGLARAYPTSETIAERLGNWVGCGLMVWLGIWLMKSKPKSKQE